MSRTPVAVLISGSGSNLQALIDACARPEYPAEIVLVISNREDAPGLKRAEAVGIRTLAINHRDFSGREAFDTALDAAIMVSGAQIVCLAGFMRILTPQFVEKWQGKMINIHPSLLPSFKGMHTHRQALKAGVKIHGCSVHYVVPEMDSGPLIVQGAVPVLAGDSEESLAARVLEAEHVIYPLALAKILGQEIPAPPLEWLISF